MENVHNYLEVIQHDPLARGETVDRRCPDAMILPQLCLYFAGDRLQMWLRCSRADNEEIGESGDSAQVEDDNIFRLLIRGQFGAQSS